MYSWSSISRRVWTYGYDHPNWTTLTSTTILPQHWHYTWSPRNPETPSVHGGHMGPMLVYFVPFYTKVWEATGLAFADGSVTSSSKTPWSGCLRTLFPSHCCDTVSTRRYKLLGGHLPKLCLPVPCEQWQSSGNKSEIEVENLYADLSHLSHQTFEKFLRSSLSRELCYSCLAESKHICRQRYSLSDIELKAFSFSCHHVEKWVI